MAEIDGGLLFAKALKREGVEYIFTLNGGHIYNLYEGCDKEGIKIIDFRHEQVAAHAAEGWAKVTGKPGVAIVTAGPGVTDAVTGIANAFQAPSPMILIGGNAGIADHLRGGLQDFDSATFLKPITKFSEQIKRVERIPEYVANAFRSATSGVPGPAYLEIPIDIVNGKCEEDDVRYPQRYRDVDVGIVGDTKAVLQQVMDELRSRGYKSPGRAWVEEVITEDKVLKAADEEMLNSTQTPIHPMRVMKELRDFLDRDATVIGDGGDIVTFAARVLNINEPGHWLDPGQFGCLGAGRGFAAAAQLARPGKQVCIVYGDGGFGLTGFDVESYVRFNLPIVSVLGNNGAWNQTTQGVVRRGGKALGTYLSQETNYAKIMEGMGGYGERVTDPEQIRPALERAFGSGRPALLDVVIDQKVAYADMGGRSRQQRQY